jgi:hypothetical protein
LFALVCTVLALSLVGCAPSRADAPTTQSAATEDLGTSDVPEIEDSSASASSPAWPSPEAIQAALQPWLGEGAVTVDWEYSNDEERCYVLPEGSFGAVVGVDEPELVLNAYLYSADQRFVSGVYNVEREYGGSTPEDVYASAVVMIRDVGAATDWPDGLREYPNVARGMVTDEWNEMVLAGNGDYWYEAAITGVTGDPAYNDALVAVGQLLAQ